MSAEVLGDSVFHFVSYCCLPLPLLVCRAFDIVRCVSLFIGLGHEQISFIVLSCFKRFFAKQTNVAILVTSCTGGKC